MSLNLWRESFWLFVLMGGIVVGTSSSSSPPSERNTEWLEDQIDTFLTQAQNNGDPTDIQVSSCKISGQQLVATAQATIARVLKGVCNPSQMEDKFHNLETQLGEQLNVIKTMIISLEDKIIELDQNLKRAKGGPIQPNQNFPRKLPPTQGVVEQHSSSYGTLSSNQTPRGGDEAVHGEEDVSSHLPIGSGPRFDEISKYNSTVSIENGRRVFSYYWAMSGMSYKLSSWSLRRAVRSSNFYIYPGGYRLYIKVIPRYTSSTMYIHTGLTKGDYDNLLSWPFTLKLRLSVLSTEDITGAGDLKSRLWDPKLLCSGSNWMRPVTDSNPECLGLGFPHYVIKDGEYVHMDRTIMKLSVYLD